MSLIRIGTSALIFEEIYWISQTYEANSVFSSTTVKFRDGSTATFYGKDADALRSIIFALPDMPATSHTVGGVVAQGRALVDDCNAVAGEEKD